MEYLNRWDLRYLRSLEEGLNLSDIIYITRINNNMTIKQEGQTNCGRCRSKLILTDAVNQANGKRDTYVCKNGHLYFDKFIPSENNKST